jgi:hypothetical protein
VRPNVDDSPSKTLWHEHGWDNRLIDSELLYDLVFDPNEAHNLVNDAQYATVLTNLRAQLHDWMHRTNDPLLVGAVPLPAGAQANDVDDATPTGPLYPPLPASGMEGAAQTNPQ